MNLDELVRQWAAWLNDPAVKAGLLFLGGMALRLWAPFVNKAIPTTLAAVSALLSTLRLMFPDHVPPEVVPGSFSFASLAGLHVYAVNSGGTLAASWVANTLIPLAAAIATQSGAKNTAQWLGLLGRGVGLLWPRGLDGRRRPPA